MATMHLEMKLLPSGGRHCRCGKMQGMQCRTWPSQWGRGRWTGSWSGPSSRDNFLAVPALPQQRLRWLQREELSQDWPRKGLVRVSPTPSCAGNRRLAASSLERKPNRLGLSCESTLSHWIQVLPLSTGSVSSLLSWITQSFRLQLYLDSLFQSNLSLNPFQKPRSDPQQAVVSGKPV